VERIVALTETLNVGDPSRPDTDLGPLATAEQRDTVATQVDDALARGARALTGGERPDGVGYFYPPTVLVDVTDDMEVMREETFGPVMPIVRVADVDEGIRRANDSRFGLAASGWTMSKATAERFQRELEAGAVGINEHGIVAAGEPGACWGGVRESGIGRAHGPYGLHEVVCIKYVFADDGRQPASAWHYPYDEDFSRFISSALPLLYGTGLDRYQHLDALASTLRRVRNELLKNQAALARNSPTFMRPAMPLVEAPGVLDVPSYACASGRNPPQAPRRPATKPGEYPLGRVGHSLQSVGVARLLNSYVFAAYFERPKHLAGSG
jgi:hypothetical protein